MLLYDNLEDCQGKLLNTICYHKGRAVFVKEVGYNEDQDAKSPYRIALKSMHERHFIWTTIADPEFSFRDFNLGYSNHGGTAAWWYRVPLKQYRQGLRSDQMKHVYSDPHMHGYAKWDYTRPVVEMLENTYPKIENCAKPLKEGDVSIIAFHKDFALGFDRLHNDFLVEHKGKVVGQTSSLKTVTLLSEFKYLQEAVQEAVG